MSAEFLNHIKLLSLSVTVSHWLLLSLGGAGCCSTSCLGWLATMQLRATDSNSFWISGAQWTNSWDQNLKVGFLISSMKVMRRPQG